MPELDPDGLPIDLPDDPSVTYDPSNSLFAPPGKLAERTLPLPARNTPLLVAEDDPERRKSPFRPHDVAFGFRLAVKGPSPYIVYRRIGGGGFGEVYEAVQPNLNRVVALKRLRRATDEESFVSPGIPEAMARAFMAEANIAATLDHPNIVPVYALENDEDGYPALAMKLVRGMPWSQMIDRDRGLMPYQDFLDKHLPILVQLCQAVAFAHSRGIIHRDLKPAQVVVGNFGEVLLLDWGLALIYDRSTLDSDKPEGALPTIGPTLDTAASPAGTPAFMAPEQTDLDARLTCPATDVYLLGGILYYLITGAYPHPGPGRQETFKQARFGFIPDPVEAAGGKPVDPELAKICMDATQVHIPKRIQTAEAFLVRLRNHMTGADRRRESERLVNEARALLEQADGDYKRLGECEDILRRAETLWLENRQAGQLRQRALALHAESALRSGDLVLARLQSAQMQEGTDKADIVHRITAREQELAAERRTRRIALAATFASLVVIIVGAFIFTMRLRAETRYAEEQRIAAEEARLQAERERAKAEERRDDVIRNVNYLTHELMPVVRQFREPSLMKGIMDAVSSVYTDVPPEERDPKMLASLGFLHQYRAEDALTEGRLADAEKHLAECLAVRTEALRKAANPNESARAYANYGLTMRLMARRAETTDDLESWSKPLRTARKIYQDLTTNTLEIRKKAIDGADSNMRAGAENALREFASTLCQIEFDIDRVYKELGDIPNRMKKAQAAAELIQLLEVLGHDEIGIVGLHAQKDILNADILMRRYKYEEAENLLRATMAALESKLSEYPDRRALSSILSKVNVGLALILQQEGKYNEAIEIHRTLLIPSAPAMSFDVSFERAVALFLYGEALLLGGRPEAAFAPLTESVEIMSDCRRSSPQHYPAITAEGIARTRLAQTQFALGQDALARQNLTRGHELLVTSQQKRGGHLGKSALLLNRHLAGDREAARRIVQSMPPGYWVGTELDAIVRQHGAGTERTAQTYQ